MDSSSMNRLRLERKLLAYSGSTDPRAAKAAVVAAYGLLVGSCDERCLRFVRSCLDRIEGHALELRTSGPYVYTAWDDVWQMCRIARRRLG